MDDHHPTRRLRDTAQAPRVAGVVAVLLSLTIIVVSHLGPSPSRAALADESGPSVASPVAAPVEPTATAAAEATATSPPSPTEPGEPATTTPTATSEPSPVPALDPTATAATPPEPPPRASPVAADVAVSPSTSTPAATATATEAAATDEAVAAAASPVGNRAAETPTAEALAVTVRVDRADVAFGLVSGTGEVDPTIAGLIGRADETGAFYVKEGALVVTVASDGPWAGTCVVRVSGTGATTIPVDQERLAWRLHGAAEWTAFPTDPADPGAACFAESRPGTTTYVFDLRLRVERTDTPGPFAATIGLSAAPATED